MVILAWLLLGSYLVTCVRGLFIWSTGPNIWPLDLSTSVWYRYASSICLPFRAIEHWRIFWLITFWTLKVISILLDQWQSYILFYYLNNLLYQTMKCSSNIFRIQHQLSVMLCCECIIWSLIKWDIQVRTWIAISSMHIKNVFTWNKASDTQIA